MLSGPRVQGRLQPREAHALQLPGVIVRVTVGSIPFISGT